MTRRITSLLLAGACALSLSACTVSDAASSPAGSASASSSASVSSPLDTTAQIAETVLLDNEAFRITAHDLDYSDPDMPAINVTVENKTDKATFVETGFISVRGVSTDGFGLFTMNPKETVDGKLWLGSIDFLEQQGIACLDAIRVTLHGHLAEDGTANLAQGEAVLSTDTGAPPVEVPCLAGKVLCNAEGIRVVAQGITLEHYPDGDAFLLHVYVENGTDFDQNVWVDVDSLNGFDLYGGVSKMFPMARKTASLCEVAIPLVMLDGSGADTVEHIQSAVVSVAAQKGRDDADSPDKNVFGLYPRRDLSSCDWTI